MTADNRPYSFTCMTGSFISSSYPTVRVWLSTKHQKSGRASNDHLSFVATPPCAAAHAVHPGPLERPKRNLPSTNIHLPRPSLASPNGLSLLLKSLALIRHSGPDPLIVPELKYYIQQQLCVIDLSPFAQIIGLLFYILHR